MCKATEYINKVNTLVKEIFTDINTMKCELSRLDRMQSDLLHKIEMDNFNAAEGYALAKSIKTIREKRRNVKNEFERLQSIRDSARMINRRVENNVNKIIERQQYPIYKPKVINM
jgi:hypothetical protein